MGAAAKSNIYNDNDHSAGRRQEQLTFVSVYFHLHSRTPRRVGRLATISTVEEGNENENGLPFRVVVKTQRRVECLEPPR